jgi:hypothetical protein
LPRDGQESTRIMSKNKKVTSPKVATKASEQLRDPKSTDDEKSVAASALVQAEAKKKRQK